MKHWLPGFAVLAVALVSIPFSTTPASASGLNLGWSSSTAVNDCPNQAASTANKNFACNTNAGASILIGSVVAPAGLVTVVGQAMIVDYQEASATLSDWWNFNTDPQNGAIGCRGNPTSSANLTMSFDPLIDDGFCGNLWQTNAASAFSYQPNTPAAGSGRLTMVGAIPTSLGGPMTAGTEWYSFRLIIDNRHTIAGALPVCTGCADGVCFAFNYLEIDNTAGVGTNAFIQTADPSGRQMVTANIASNPPCTGVPTKRTTWGQVKSLYR